MMGQVMETLADPVVSVLVAGVVVTGLIQLVKKLWPWLADRASANKKRCIAALAAIIATLALQAAAGKDLASVDWAEVIKMAAASFGVATGTHTLVVSSAYSTKEEDA
jgi:hypothetical protein